MAVASARRPSKKVKKEEEDKTDVKTEQIDDFIQAEQKPSVAILLLLIIFLLLFPDFLPFTIFSDHSLMPGCPHQPPATLTSRPSSPTVLPTTSPPSAMPALSPAFPDFVFQGGPVGPLPQCVWPVFKEHVGINQHSPRPQAPQLRQDRGLGYQGKVGLQGHELAGQDVRTLCHAHAHAPYCRIVWLKTVGNVRYIVVTVGKAKAMYKGYYNVKLAIIGLFVTYQQTRCSQGCSTITFVTHSLHPNRKS